MGVSGQRHDPAALYPLGKDSRYPLLGLDYWRSCITPHMYWWGSTGRLSWTSAAENNGTSMCHCQAIVPEHVHRRFCNLIFWQIIAIFLAEEVGPVLIEFGQEQIWETSLRFASSQLLYQTWQIREITFWLAFKFVHQSVNKTGKRSKKLENFSFWNKWRNLYFLRLSTWLLLRVESSVNAHVSMVCGFVI
jgi:hypothetical protein